MSPAALYVIECLSTMDELDSEPSVEELSKAIDSLASMMGFTRVDQTPQDYVHYCSHCTKTFASAGKKELYHRT